MSFTLVQCLMEGTVIVYGISTRNQYTFTPNQKTLPIANDDLQDILNKKDIQGGCCGHPRIEKNIFILAE